MGAPTEVPSRPFEVLASVRAELETICDRASAMDVRYLEYGGRMANGVLGSMHLPSVSPIDATLIHELRGELPSSAAEMGELRRHLATVDADLSAFNDHTAKIEDAIHDHQYTAVRRYTDLASRRLGNATSAARSALEIIRRLTA